MIFDWRAPISEMFYDYDIGRAGFEAPVGWIEGELTRKRQFKIQNGIMEYAIESSTNIALHRIAFLLYRFKNQITAEDVTILSPNKVFADYISGVIPEFRVRCFE